MRGEILIIRIIVVLDGKVTVFTFEKTPQMIHQYDTHENPTGKDYPPFS